ncbi:MAG: ribonuclease III [Oscillospiraceae bacterium]|jgi:ribonuclease-3
MRELMEKLGIKFNSPKLLRQALTHSSWANENRNKADGHNERLEFLGDSILGFVAADYLYRNFRDLPEGELTRRRAALVCEQSLYKAAVELSLGEKLRLGHGEELSGGRERPSILADAMEAVIAAVYLDSGIGTARSLITRLILSRNEGPEEVRDSKTQLQEEVQRTPGSVLSYEVVGERGPDHNKEFFVEVSLNGNIVGRGSGKTKKEAEQDAARAALEKLNR